ncbi:MAG: hypothetical protein HKO54_05890 [Flavobacteriaceae bacterium]|nr:hypothetical protein [Flavobacteriaceae bacterium]
MKTIKSIALALLLVMGTALYANNNPAAEKVKKEQVTQEIAQLLKSPRFELNETTTAQVLFVVNKDNEIVVTSVDTENWEVEDYIKYRLNYKKLDIILERGKEYKLPVTITSET